MRAKPVDRRKTRADPEDEPEGVKVGLHQTSGVLESRELGVGGRHLLRDVVGASDDVGGALGEQRLVGERVVRAVDVGQVGVDVLGVRVDACRNEGDKKKLLHHVFCLLFFCTWCILYNFFSFCCYCFRCKSSLVVKDKKHQKKLCKKKE